jgi:6-phosphogluconolactonase
MHRLFAKAPYRSQIPWAETHFFWVDERMVPYGHHDSNFGLARRDFLAEVPIPFDHLHPIAVLEDMEEAAARYRAELEAVSEGDSPVFDLVFLGMGSDGHTASLFPEDPFLFASNQWLATVKGGNPDLWRITLTLSVLNRARHVVFLVCGAEKAPALRAVMEDPHPRLPAAHVRPKAGRLTWLLDKSAASLIRRRVAQNTQGP